jgi:tetratricopeptide (TPR) repeat protein
MRLEEFLMFRKYLVRVLAGFALLITASPSASAQTGELRGHVILKQADGTSVPASDAVIDVYRTDLPGKYPTKANKKGEFVFAGLPYVGTFVIAVSHPAAQPTWIPNVKAGRGTDYEISLSPGDGRRLTLDEIKAAQAQSGPSTAGGSESTADKAKREELEKKNAEILAKNKNIEAANEIVARTFKSGNEARAAKNYDEAIKLYDEGLAADPEQPALLTNKVVSLKARGVDRYNAAITAKDDAAKTSGIELAKADFREAAELSKKALDLIKAQPVPTEPTEQARYNGNKAAALITRAEAMRLFVTKVDSSQADAGEAAFEEYIAAETDPVRKEKAQLDEAQMLLDAGAADKAYTAFQRVLTAQPDNADANLGAGLALYSSGDKAKYQDAANYLQHFVDVAPETNKFKADAKAILAEMKNTDKVVPDKTPAARRTRRP